jgi:hypothetical protein
MRLEHVAVGDVIRARIKGRSLWGEVTEVKDGIVYFSPISAAAGWRHASAREIIGHWRKTGHRKTGLVRPAARMTTSPRPSRASSSRCRRSTSDRSRRDGHARHVALSPCTQASPPAAVTLIAS